MVFLAEFIEVVEHFTSLLPDSEASLQVKQSRGVILLQHMCDEGQKSK